MNTIKFSPINMGRMETSNVEDYNVIEREFNKKKYYCYEDAQISLYVTKRCNASCKFCMNFFEDRFLKCKELEDDLYFSKVSKYLDIFKDNKPWITITGGEPTRSKRLNKLLKIIKDKGYKIRTFSTNGSGLLDIVDGEVVIKTLLDNNVFNNISISRMATDDKENSHLMNISVDDSNNSKLEKIAMIGNNYDMEMRISCNLMKNGVSSLDDMLKFKEFYNNVGFKAVMFRELVHNTLDSAFVDMKKIVEEIRHNKDFVLLKVLKGHYYTVEVYRYKDEVVKCYLENDVLDKDIIREFVIYPDGKLDNGFNNESIMEV